MLAVFLPETSMARLTAADFDQELLIPAGGRRLRRGCFYEARITAAEEYDLYGELTERRKR